MKKIFCTFFFLLALIQINCFAQDTLKYKLKVGDILTYSIVDSVKIYTLTITFTSVPDTKFDYAKIAFNWKKTGSVNQEGSVKFAANSMDAYNLMVGSANNLDFEKLTMWKTYGSNALWLSEKAMMSYLLGNTFDVKLLGDTKPTTFKLTGRFFAGGKTYKTKPCGLIVKKFQVESLSDNAIMILDSDENPLITYLRIKERNFIMVLKSID